MFNRRFIRTKVVQFVYSYLLESYDDYTQIERDLRNIFIRVYDLYLQLFILLIDIADYFYYVYQQNEKSYFKDPILAKTHLKFYNNKLIDLIRNNTKIQEYIKSTNFTWKKNQSFVKDLYNKIIKLPEFNEYTATSENEFTQDKDFILFLIEKIFYNNDNFIFSIEEQSSYYTDNTEFAIFCVAVTLENFSIDKPANNNLLPKFKNYNDELFAFELLRNAILKLDNYIAIVKEHIVKKEFEIVPQIEKAILYTALAEIMNFPEIPIKVSLNEYIDIAKEYGIPEKSYAFVNVVLDKIVADLKQKNLINKSGRGLIEN